MPGWEEITIYLFLQVSFYTQSCTLYSRCKLYFDGFVVLAAFVVCGDIGFISLEESLCRALCDHT